MLGHCTNPNLKCAHVYVVAISSLDSTLSRLKCLLRSNLKNDRIRLHTIHVNSGLYASATKMVGPLGSILDGDSNLITLICHQASILSSLKQNPFISFVSHNKVEL